MSKTADIEIPADFIEEIKKADEYLRYPDFKIAFRSGAEWAYKKLSPCMGWVKASEPPEIRIRVLITDGDTVVGGTLFYNMESDIKWFCDFGYEVKATITHWMPLPAIPSSPAE